MPQNEIKAEFKVLHSERRITKVNEPYYVLELLDASGNKHDARVWKDALEKRKDCFLPQDGYYLGNVKSRENILQGQKQLVIEDYWLLAADKVH